MFDSSTPPQDRPNRVQSFLSFEAPGRRRRLDSLLRGARVGVRIVLGAGGMLVVAALIEGFWSASPAFSMEAKFVVGIVAWGVVTVYLLVFGRGDGP